MIPAALVGVVLFFLFVSGVRIVKEFERGVVLRLGRYIETKGPGFKWLIPGVDKMYTVDTRIVARDVPPQDVITKDNVSVKVNAVIYFRVVDCDKAILKVENYLYATSQYAQTTLRSILGQHEIDEMLSERESINQSLQEVLDRYTDAWGVKVTSVELKHVDLPHEMQRAMAKQAEAERERRAKVIAAAGELQASEKLSQAAATLNSAPGAMTLRYLQTLAEIAVENNSTTLFPVPIDLLEGISGWAVGRSTGTEPPERVRHTATTSGGVTSHDTADDGASATTAGSERAAAAATPPPARANNIAVATPVAAQAAPAKAPAPRAPSTAAREAQRTVSTAVADLTAPPPAPAASNVASFNDPTRIESPVDPSVTVDAVDPRR